MKIKSPVAAIIFNRIEEATALKESLKLVSPNKLYLIADGWRSDDEKEVCLKVREVFDEFAERCEVIKIFSHVNLGCKNRIKSGLDQVFKNEDNAIILEDDCIPDPTFFRFCDELLEKYKDDERIMMISGNQFHSNEVTEKLSSSYYFSYFYHIWGWATWKRAWEKYDDEMKILPELVQGEYLKKLFGNSKDAQIWENIFNGSFNNLVSTWDHRWILSCIKEGAYSISPKVNLVTNIGFNENATRTKSKSFKSGVDKKNAINFPLKHPQIFIREAFFDRLESKYMSSNLLEKIQGKIYRAFQKTKS